MPWVKREDCTGCGICVEECPVDAISLDAEDIAVIDMALCIRCGVCHDVCPQEAVKHDRLKIPHEIEDNVAMTRRCMDACALHLGSEEEKRKCLNRMVKHFNKEKAVAEKTLERLEDIRSQMGD